MIKYSALPDDHRKYVKELDLNTTSATRMRFSLSYQRGTCCEVFPLSVKIQYYCLYFYVSVDCAVRRLVLADSQSGSTI